jgi:serine/threonine-protein kinase
VLLMLAGSGAGVVATIGPGGETTATLPTEPVAALPLLAPVEPPPEEPEPAPRAAADPAPERDHPDERRRPRPAGPSSARGTVMVATPGGWADVVHRGRSLGQTPLTAELPAGRQTLELRPFGRGPAQRVVVEVDPDRTARVSRPIRP